ncbi:MAG: DUF2807 domain-containing protein, partial [Cyclobacteriaceae bacterium]
DNKEIVEDIESRIAEIFLMKLNDNKQVINSDDVESLISTMGTTQDFEATIDLDDDTTSRKTGDNSYEDNPYDEEPAYSDGKKLYRDSGRKLLGGVAAGIAQYFSIDPIWVRLLLLSFVIFPIFSWPLASVSSLTVLVYIVLWIVLPHRTFEKQQKVKKLYRNPDEKVLGGVASGLANYFGIDKVAARVLFIIGIFLGFTGPILYIILWIITPEAKSISDKLEMQGEPVTLHTIESNIKKELNEEGNNGEESAFVKVIMFPFRLIALIIKAISQFLSPFLRFIIEAVRVVFGVFVFAFGFMLIIGLLVFLISFYGGLADTPVLHIDKFHGSAAYLRGVINDSTIVFGTIIGLIPALLLTMTGISIISKRWVLNSFVGWPLLGVWLLGVIGFAIALPNNINKFSKHDTYTETKVYSLQGKMPVLKINELYDDYSGIRLRLRGHDSDDFKLEVDYEANGKTRKEAIDNAKMISYNVSQQDSVFVFDSNIQKVKNGYRFRFQNAVATFYIPYNVPFKIDEELGDILYNTLYRSGYSQYQLQGNDWIFNDQGRLGCLTCSNPANNSISSPSKDESRESKRFSLNNFNGKTNFYDLKDFTSIEANGLFEVEIIQGTTYSVQAKGPNNSLNKSDIYMSGSTLILDFNKNRNWYTSYRDEDKIGVVITVPKLEEMEISGASKIYLRDFKTDRLSINLSGASTLEGTVKADDVTIDMHGACNITLKGVTRKLTADIGGASHLRTDKLIAETVKVDAGGASKANVYGDVTIDLEASGASRIYYSGPANVSIDRGGGSRIRRE